MYCKKCGKKLADGDRFCGNCGTRTEVSSMGFSEEPEKPKKNFDFGSFNWDLEGYPDAEKSTTDDIDFNWNSVLEEKKRRELEEKSFVEPAMSENELFDKLKSEENNKSATEISFDWELGNTTRVDKTSKYDRLVNKADSERNMVNGLSIDESDLEEVSAPINDVDNIEVALAEGLAAAASPRKSIDRFYTFNQKNEEFQALLDQEYERLRNRIREDSEAEAIIADKEEKLEQARATWSKEPLEDISAESETLDSGRESAVSSGESAEALDDIAVGSGEADKAEAIEDSEAEVSVHKDMPESESSEYTKAEEANDNAEEQGEVEASDSEAVSEYKDEDVNHEDSVDEAECEKQNSETTDNDDDTDKTEEKHNAGSESDSSTENCEEVSDSGNASDDKIAAEDKEAEDSTDIEASKPERRNPPSEEETREEKDASVNNSEESRLHYSDIFADDDVNDGNTKSDSKKGRWKLILLDVIIFILAVSVVVSGILVFAKDSAAGKKLTQGINWVTEKFTGDKSSTQSKSNTQTSDAKSMDEIIAAVKKKYVNIGSVKFDESLKFESSKDYGVEGLAEAKKFEDKTFKGNSTLREELVNTACAYYSGMADKINSGSDDVLSLVDEKSELYGHIKAIAKGDENQSVNEVKIGEIKGSNGKFFVLLEVSESKTSESKINTGQKIITLVTEGDSIKITAVADVK